MEKSVTHTYHVSGMSCGGCAATVKNKLSTIPAISSVKVDLGKQQVEIPSSQLIKITTLQDVLSNTSYTICDLRVSDNTMKSHRGVENKYSLIINNEI
jgi:copper chaperone